MLKGLTASPGIAIGRAYVYKPFLPCITKEHVTASEVAEHTHRLENAVKKSREQLQELRIDLVQSVGEAKAAILDAHMMILEDDIFLDEIRQMIQEELVPAEKAVQTVTSAYFETFARFEDEYTRERAADIKDVGVRLVKNIIGAPTESLSHLEPNTIVVAHDLTPTDTAQLDLSCVSALATDVGGKTSHTAIMARSLELPAVVGLEHVSTAVSTGDLIIVDGLSGQVIVNPSDSTVNTYRRKIEAYLSERERLRRLIDLPAQTSDHQRVVELCANIGTPADVCGALENGAVGVGLFRTEFLYLNRTSLPSEEEQLEAYRAVAEKMAPGSVVIRTLDIGGDKKLDYMEMPDEENPFLGCRAIRLCLKYPDLFKTQLRAILRASHYGNIKMMYPMISSVAEIRQANAVLEQAKRELTEENIPFDPSIQVGIMVEIPAAAIAADLLARHVDFFSIGTNDLIQYTLAADRMNEQISYLYEPFHPAVLRLIHHIITAAHREGKKVGMCGELAGDSKASLLLLGLGLDEFSMSSSSICNVKDIIRSTNYAQAQQLAEQALQLETPEEVLSLLSQHPLA